MFFKKLTKPLLFFLCIGIVLTGLSSVNHLYEEKTYLEKELLRWQDEVSRLRTELDRLEKINSYAEIYQTSPEIVSLVIEESEKYQLKPVVMLELIKVESNFNPRAISRIGAKGLCQINPLTAPELARELNLEYSEAKLFDNHYNIQLGTYYLAKLLKSYNMDYHRALTAYNRGPTGLQNYIKTRGTAVSRYSQKISSRSQQLTLNTANTAN